MSLYRMTPESLIAVPQTGFAEEGLRERSDLQRLLRDHIETIAPGCMVLAEEFGDWDDSRRRIDLLCLDADARLVVVELKRTETGGEMELQALRYAAFVSTMTFEQAVRAHGQYIEGRGLEADAEDAILSFLGWSAPDEESFAQEVRVVLASADFSKELTSAVLWLNERELDITCVRVRPYRLGGEILLDVQTVIPLPGAEDYTVRVREKEREARRARGGSRDWTRYDLALAGREYSDLSKRRALFTAVKHYCDRGASPEEITAVLPTALSGKWFALEGTLDSHDFQVRAAAGERSFDVRRWYVQDGELIHFADKTYAFSNQWGGAMEDRIQPLIDRFGERGDAVTRCPDRAA